MAGNFAHRERRGGFMPDERQEARNDARYGHRREEENRSDEMQGGWSEERRMREREGRPGDRYGSDEGWGQREDWRSGPARRGSGNYASEWMGEQSGSRYGGEPWRGEYGGGRGGYGGREAWRGGEDWRGGYGGGERERGAYGGGREGGRGAYGEDWRGGYGGGYGAWEGSRGGPDHTRGGGFTGPQDAYTRGMQGEDMPGGYRGGLGGMPGGWPSGRGGEHYGRGGDWRGEEGGERWGQGRGSSERWGEEMSGQRSSFRGLGPKGYQRSDERLKEVICEKLSDDDRVDARDISLEVKNGEVALQGHVPDRGMKYRVEDLIEQCGVREIHNNLRVQSAQSQTGAGSGSAASASMSSGSSAAGQSGQSASHSTGQGSGMSDKASSEARGAGQSSGSHKT